MNNFLGSNHYSMKLEDILLGLGINMIKLEEKLIFREKEQEQIEQEELLDMNDKIFNKLKEIIDFPEGVQSLNINLEMDKRPVINLVYIPMDNNKLGNKINLVLS